MNSAVVDNYLWTKSGNSIKNIGTGKYLSISPNPGVSSDSKTVYLGSYTGYFSIYSYSSGYYYLAINNTNTGFYSTNTAYYWYLRSVTREEKNETKKAFTGTESTFLARMEKDHTHTMKYLDSYGVAQPLTHICRNEHIKLTVNVSYHQSTGGFDVSVSGWKSKGNETTFD